MVYYLHFVFRLSQLSEIKLQS